MKEAFEFQPQKKEKEESLDLAEAKKMVNDAMNRAEKEGHENCVTVPINMINEAIKAEDGSIEIYCDDGRDYYLSTDGYLYDRGVGA